MTDAATFAAWTALHRTFDPIEPAPAELRVDRREYNPLSEKIAPRLALPLPHQKYILAGGVGSGKSTELRATAAAAPHGKLVVLVDLWRHFQGTVADPSALDHLDPAEVLGLLGLAILRTGTELLGHRWGRLEARLGEAIRGLRGAEPESGAELDVVGLARGLALVVGGAMANGGLGAGALGATAAAGLQMLDAVASSAAWTWKLGLRGRPRGSDQDAPVREALQAVNALLDDLRREQQREVVLLVDGLDRVREPETFAHLFVESSLLAELRCDLVLTLELGLVQRHGARLSAWRVFHFTYIPVCDRAQPEGPHPPGLAFFRSLVERRFEQLRLSPRFAPAQVDRLAVASGGRLRDFIRLVREVIVLAMLEGAASATDEAVDDAIRDLRREREAGLNADELALLGGLLADPLRRLPGGDLAVDLLGRHLLLAYPNEHLWYLPHPILLPLLRRTGSPASA
jgi:hypothetical protein